MYFRSPLMTPQQLVDFPAHHGWTRLIYPFMFAVDPLMVNEIQWQDWRIPALYLLLVVSGGIALFYGTRRPGGDLAEAKPTRFLTWMAIASYFAWLSVEAIYRYLLPLDMLAPLLIVICIGMIPVALRERWQMAAALLIVLACTIHPGDWGRHHVWPKSIPDVTLPAISTKDNPMILMAGWDAYAYMLPAFPPEIPFMRIETRSFHPDEKVGILNVMRQRIDDHKGKLMLFVPTRDLPQAEKGLPSFHVALVPKSCRAATDNLYEPHLDRPEEEHTDYPKDYSLCDLRYTGKGSR
jgi:hypothetical protein